MDFEPIRINKYIAECGICSRRQADKLIEEGRVLINGKTAMNGDKVCSNDFVTLNGNEIKKNEEKVYLAFNKPVGIVCTAEKNEKNNIIDFIKYPKRVTYAGRLDKDSEGLIILTNDGELIDEMMRARNAHEKEYVVSVNKPISADFISKLRQGVYLKELDTTTRECKVRKISEKQFEIVLTQGLNRQIRRMCTALGYKVTALKRVRVINIKLGNLKRGQYRELTANEIDELFNMVMSDYEG